MLRIVGLFIVMSVLTGCAGSAYRLPKVTDADMQQMNQKIASQKAPLKTYERSDKTYRQTLAVISSRLTKNAKPLCEHAGYQSCYFQVAYDPGQEVNAYASDNYKITVYKGLLQYLQNNDEMAAVIAHEMGHHLARHNEEKLQNAQAGAAVAGILTAVLLGAADANNPSYNSYQQQNQETIENMMQAGAGIGILSYSKEQEREADLLATYLLSRAGYNLKRAENTMVILAKFSGQGDPAKTAFLSSHPAGAERVVAWDKAIDEIKSNRSKLPYPKEMAETVVQTSKDQK